MLQASWGRSGKQQKEQNSPNLGSFLAHLQDESSSAIRDRRLDRRVVGDGERGRGGGRQYESEDAIEKLRRPSPPLHADQNRYLTLLLPCGIVTLSFGQSGGISGLAWGPSTYDVHNEFEILNPLIILF